MDNTEVIVIVTNSNTVTTRDETSIEEYNSPRVPNTKLVKI